MATKKITVTRESSTGLNTHFNVPGQGEITRAKLVREVEAGKHPGYHIRDNGEVTYVASNPDRSKENNLG